MDVFPAASMGATHASRGRPWMAAPGLREAGTAQRNGFTAVRKAPPQGPACVDRGVVRHNPSERGYRSPDIVTSSGALTK